MGFSLAPGMRVGLFGGSFNPAHAGHVHVAEMARKRLGLDRVIWLVTPQNPLKSARDLASLADRLASARRQARGPSMIVSDAETRMDARYTVDMLRVLKARFPGVRFVWIMGGDSLTGFHHWRGWVEIMSSTPVAVIARPDPLGLCRASPAARRFAAARLPADRALGLAATKPPAWLYLTAPLNETSSTLIRRASFDTAAPQPFRIDDGGAAAPQSA